jgi:hypothetical protein
MDGAMGTGSIQDDSILTESAPKPGAYLPKAVAGHEQHAINLWSEEQWLSYFSKFRPQDTPISWVSKKICIYIHESHDVLI